MARLVMTEIQAQQMISALAVCARVLQFLHAVKELYLLRVVPVAELLIILAIVMVAFIPHLLP